MGAARGLQLCVVCSGDVYYFMNLYLHKITAVLERCSLLTDHSVTGWQAIVISEYIFAIIYSG